MWQLGREFLKGSWQEEKRRPMPPAVLLLFLAVIIVLNPSSVLAPFLYPFRCVVGSLSQSGLGFMTLLTVHEPRNGDFPVAEVGRLASRPSKAKRPMEAIGFVQEDVLENYFANRRRSMAPPKATKPKTPAQAAGSGTGVTSKLSK